jgi:hypothetical protein
MESCHGDKFWQPGANLPCLAQKQTKNTSKKQH